MTFRLAEASPAQRDILLELDFTEELARLRKEERELKRSDKPLRIKLPPRYAGDETDYGPPMEEDETVVGAVTEIVGSDLIVTKKAYQDGWLRRTLPHRRVRSGVSPRPLGDVMAELYRNTAYDDFIHAVSINRGVYPSGTRVFGIALLQDAEEFRIRRVDDMKMQPVGAVEVLPVNGDGKLG